MKHIDLGQSRQLWISGKGCSNQVNKGITGTGGCKQLTSVDNRKAWGLGNQICTSTHVWRSVRESQSAAQGATHSRGGSGPQQASVENLSSSKQGLKALNMESQRGLKTFNIAVLCLSQLLSHTNRILDLSRNKVSESYIFVKKCVVASSLWLYNTSHVCNLVSEKSDCYRTTSILFLFCFITSYFVLFLQARLAGWQGDSNSARVVVPVWIPSMDQCMIGILGIL